MPTAERVAAQAALHAARLDAGMGMRAPALDVRRSLSLTMAPRRTASATAALVAIASSSSPGSLIGPAASVSTQACPGLVALQVRERATPPLFTFAVLMPLFAVAPLCSRSPC